MGPVEIKGDLDNLIAHHSHERSHQGYWLKGRTPVPTLREALGVNGLPVFLPADEEAVSFPVK